MSLLEELKKKLAPEDFTKVEEALGDDFNYDLVPRSRLNKVIQQRNALREENEELKEQIPDPDSDPKSGKGKGREKEGGEGSKTYTQEELEAEIAKKQTELRIKQAAMDKLKEKGAQDLDLVYGLLDQTKLAFNDKNELTGLDDQLTTLTKDKSFLFKESVPGGTGKDGQTDPENSSKLDAALNDVFGGFGVDMTSK